jgi:hypothetical protein
VIAVMAFPPNYCEQGVARSPLGATPIHHPALI